MMTKDVFSIELKQSATLLCYLTLLHSLFFILVLLFPLDWFWRALLSLLLIMSFRFYYIGHYLMTGRYKIIKMVRSSEIWALYYGNGQCVEDLKLSHCVVTPQLVTLNFRATSFRKKCRVYITADEADPELLRLLRVYCRDPKTFH
ncbi:MAG: hypothetical protein ACI9QV_000264 [Methylophagaceae bacterium]|jgi:hypothetical protein